jgi:hypothetical protein
MTWPLQIGERHMVVVDNGNRARTRRREIEKERRAQAACADHQHARSLEFRLPRSAHFAQHDMARIALKLFRRQHCVNPGSVPKGIVANSSSCISRGGAVI